MRPLFKVLPDGCDPAYRNIFTAANGRCKLVRENCEELWGIFHDLADQDFVNRFPFEFHQRWFEMYLGATLRNIGLDVSAPKPGPDFRVVLNEQLIYIEAITPEAGHPLHADHVPEPIYQTAAGKLAMSMVPHTQITLRLAAAFRAKETIYDRYRRKGYIPSNAICIVATSLRDIPHAWADAEDFWIRAFYGVGDRFVAFEKPGLNVVEGRHHRALLQGAEGTMAEVDPLLDEKHSGIAGVIGSSSDAANLCSPLGDDFLLMPHALASHPFPPKFLGRGVELMLRQSATGSERWDVSRVDHGAVNPQGPQTMSVTYEGQQHDVVWEVSNRELSVAVLGRRIAQLISRATDLEPLVKQIAMTILSHQNEVH